MGKDKSRPATTLETFISVLCFMKKTAKNQRILLLHCFFFVFSVLNNEMTLFPKRGRGREKDQDNWSISAISESSTILPFPPNFAPEFITLPPAIFFGETNGGN